MRYTGPKARLCRREGVNLFGSPKYQKIIQKNSNIPGMHGGKRMGKVTEYGKQLREKQKARRIFCLSEKQFRKYFDQAERSQGVTGDMLMQGIERRLDNVLFRAGFAMTRMQSRQFASHGLFLLNGRRVDIPSIQVNIGDKIELKASKKGSAVFKKILEELKDYTAPSWLKVDAKHFTIEIVELPVFAHFDQLVELRLIVEYYSR